MPEVPLEEAAANLQEYGRMCHDEPVIVLCDGRPAFQLVPVDGDDDLVNDLIQSNAEFREMLQHRKSGNFMSAEEALRRLS